MLEGAAAHSIQGITLSELNYVAATEILRECFGKKQQIVTGHMDDLLKLPPCAGDHTAQLRLVYDKVHANFCGLEALGVHAEQYGSVLIPIVMLKLPPDVHLHIARVTTRDIWEIDELLQAMRTEVEAREISDGIKINKARCFSNSTPQQRIPCATAFTLYARETGSKDTGSNNVVCV